MAQPTALQNPGTYPRHNWLPAVVPADARRFRVLDQRLAATLASAGAELVDSAPDVEIASAELLRGDARQAVVPLESLLPEGGGRPIRAARRFAGFARVRLRSAVARKAVLRAGYRQVAVIPWEWEQVVRLPGASSPPTTLAERLPLGTLVVGDADVRRPTLLDSALADASKAANYDLEVGTPLVRQSGLVVVADRGVVRVAVGPAARELVIARAALDALGAVDPPPAVAERVPWLIADGSTGLARWSLERRLPGQVAPIELGERVLWECVDFLAALHASVGGDDHRESLTSQAAVVAGVSDERGGRAVRALAESLEETLADVPRGFGHGDFWTRNLLTQGDGLVGVVDWHSAGRGRLPLVDLLHLRLSAIFQRRRQYLGTALVQYLLPWARAGGDEFAVAYSQRVGVGLTPKRLEALSLAYWLGRTARELELYADRAERPVWLRHNVELVVRELEHLDASNQF
jgi:aminoglycoside phosphotransferase (APT) family kinase protein